jgi:signal transduction histidine kinase
MLRFATRSVRNKVFTVVLLATFAALIVEGVAMMAYHLNVYQERAVNSLATQADILGRASAAALAFDDPKSAEDYLMLLKARPQISAAGIYNARGKLFASYSGRTEGIQNYPPLPELDGSRIEGNQLVLFRRIVENNEILGTVYLRTHYELPERLKTSLGILAAVMALSLLVAFLLSAWLQSILTKPILAVTNLARQVMEKRDFSLRVHKTTNDEVGVLVDAFNDMLGEVGRRAQSLEKSNRALEIEMAERKQVDDALQKLNVELERRVFDRTSQLEAANKELESFSYSVSHDLRAPLRAIVGYSEMLLEDHVEKLDQEGRRKLEVVASEAQRMGILIDELLAFSRLGRKAMQVTEIDMTNLARATYESLNVEYQSEKPELRLGTLPPGRGDRILMQQVWANLIANAIKFSSKREKPLVEVSAVSDEKENIYFVRDNGAGFDPRYKSKLFGVFQRLHNSSEFPGTGVGLALVQRIVARHGGRVWADSNLNEGATFYFTLPKGENHGTI